MALVRFAGYLIVGLAIGTYLYGIGTNDDEIAVFVAAYITTFALITLIRR